MTRAVGSENRIQHLQYLVYQKDGSGNYQQFYDNRKVNTDLSSWPVKAIAISLPKDKEYKVVFLGNVDKSVFGTYQTKEVLTGTGKGSNYTNARIILPSVEFSDNTMFFLANAAFNTSATAYVPITLKRIVSRNDLTKEGLSAAYSSGVTSDATYKTAYWMQTIKERMKESLFTGENSAFRYQVAEAIKRNLIYPFIYIGLVTPADASVLAATYPAVAKYNAEWSTYNPGIAITALFDNTRLVYSDLITSQYANNLFIRYAQYLYDTFLEPVSKDPAALKNVLERIFADNISINENGILQPSVDKAIKMTITALNSNYTAGSLLPWRFTSYNANAVVDINPAPPMPGAVDFDLKTDAAYQISGQKYYRMKDNPDKTKDKYISVISLGEPQTSGNKLAISKIYTASSGGTTIDYVPATKQELAGTQFTAGSFHRNIKSVSTQKIQGVSLIDPKLLIPDVNFRQKIEVNYYHAFQAMNPVTNGNSFSMGSTGAKASFSISGIINGAAKVSTMQSFVLNYSNYKYLKLDLEDLTLISFPFVTFACPVVSPSNINVTTMWETVEVND